MVTTKTESAFVQPKRLDTFKIYSVLILGVAIGLAFRELSKVFVGVQL